MTEIGIETEMETEALEERLDLNPKTFAIIVEKLVTGKLLKLIKYYSNSPLVFSFLKFLPLVNSFDFLFLKLLRSWRLV